MNYREEVYDSYASISGMDRPLRTKYQSLAHNLTAHLLAASHGGKILDIGSGQGELLTLCQDLALEAEGVDASRELVEACNRRGLKVSLITSLRSYLATGSNEWSVVCMIDVLEHFSKSEASEILGLIRSHVLKPSGKIILQVPNMQSLFGPLNLYHDITHEWAYTQASITQLLRSVGFKNVQGFPANYPMQGIYILRHVLRTLLYLALRAILLIDQPNRGNVLTPNLIAIAESRDGYPNG